MKNIKYDFVIITPGRSGSEHLTETLNYFDDIKVGDELFNRAYFGEDSFNEFLKTHVIWRTLGYFFNREKISRSFFNFPLQYLIKCFLNQAAKNVACKNGFKITLDQLRAYPSVLKVLFCSNVSLIYLNREDRLAQVLSLLKARKTGVYHQRSVQSKSESFSFNPDRVKSIFEMLQQEEVKLLKRLNNVQHLTITYEQLFGDYPKQVSSIREFLNLPDRKIRNYSSMTKVNSASLDSWVINLDEIQERLYR